MCPKMQTQGQDLRFFSEKISKKFCICRHALAILDIKLCDMGRELDPNFSPCRKHLYVHKSRTKKARESFEF